MKRKILSFVAFFGLASMTNQYMYVTQDVNIQGTGNFYLRNTSQLLQGGTGAQEPETCLCFKKEQLTIFNTTIGVHQ